MNGKGDTPRPVNRAKFEKNFTGIKWKSKTKTMKIKQVHRYTKPG